MPFVVNVVNNDHSVICSPKMRKKLVLLQVLAILIAVFHHGIRAAGQDEGNKILSNIFYPYLATRYVKNQVELYHMTCTSPIFTAAYAIVPVK